MRVEQDNFFNRPVGTVATEFAAGIYDRKTKSVTATGNPGKIMQVATAEGDKQFKVTSVEPYLEADASPIWQGKRADEIRALTGGETITYNSRSGKLTFIKTMGADNILIRGLEEVGTGLKINTASEVTKALDLSQREVGRLTLVEDDQFRFARV